VSRGADRIRPAARTGDSGLRSVIHTGRKAPAVSRDRGRTDGVFERRVVEFLGHRRGLRRLEIRRFGGVFPVRGDEGRFGDRFDEDGVAADDSDVALGTDDARDPGGVVVVLLVVEREQRLDEGVPGRVAEVELFGDRVDLGAVADDGAAPSSVVRTQL